MGSSTTRLCPWSSGIAESHATMNMGNRKESNAVDGKTRARNSARTPGSPIFQNICQSGFKVNQWSPACVIPNECWVAPEFWEIHRPE